MIKYGIARARRVPERNPCMILLHVVSKALEKKKLKSPARSVDVNIVVVQDKEAWVEIRSEAQLELT
eukprot:1890553-Pyramimonas_sp.AAC.1